MWRGFTFRPFWDYLIRSSLHKTEKPLSVQGQGKYLIVPARSAIIQYDTSRRQHAEIIYDQSELTSPS